MEVDFLFSNQLVNEVEKLIRNSEKYLLLVSPFIDLDSRIQDALSEKKDDPEFELKVLFGKNKGNPYKSVKKDSLEFLMKFPNLEIRYNDLLHAKFFQNDTHFIMTSMNLYGYSLAKNIEVGVLGRHGSKSLAGKFADKTGDFVSKGVDSLTEGVLGIENENVDPIQKFKTYFEGSELKFRTQPIMVKKSGLNVFGKEKMDGFTVLENTFNIGHKPSLEQESVEIDTALKDIEKPKPSSLNKTETKSASQLGKLKGITGASVTKAMEEEGFIADGQITDAGFANGLEMKKYMGNEYIAYPVDIDIS